jgi:hypothetical protein
MSLGAVLTLILITDAMPMHWNCGYVQTTDGREEELKTITRAISVSTDGSTEWR